MTLLDTDPSTMALAYSFFIYSLHLSGDEPYPDLGNELLTLTNLPNHTVGGGLAKA
jgi:hypothetical protein